MRIGFDAKRYVYNQTGLGNYSRSLVAALSKHQVDNQYVLFNKSFPEGFELNPAENISCVSAEKKGLFFRQIGITSAIEKAKIDLYHGLSAELPILRPRNTRLVVTVHDLIFLKYPGYYSFWDRLIYTYKLRHALRIADAVICTSQVTRNDLSEIFPMWKAKYRVIGQPCHEIFYNRTDNATLNTFRAKYKLPENFMLCVSSFEKRKNHHRLIQAWKKIHSKQRLPLVLTGKSGDAYDDVIAESKDESELHIFENASLEELHMLYQSAEVTVLPSEYEGFGIPALESLASGTPVITGSGSSMAEIVGPSEHFFIPDSVESITQAIVSVSDQKLLSQLFQSQQKNLNKFSDEAIAGAYLKLYNETGLR